MLTDAPDQTVTRASYLFGPFEERNLVIWTTSELVDHLRARHNDEPFVEEGNLEAGSIVLHNTTTGNVSITPDHVREGEGYTHLLVALLQ